jgi:hypothetical protein
LRAGASGDRIRDNGLERQTTTRLIHQTLGPVAGVLPVLHLCALVRLFDV